MMAKTKKMMHKMKNGMMMADKEMQAMMGESKPGMKGKKRAKRGKK